MNVKTAKAESDKKAPPFAKKGDDAEKKPVEGKGKGPPPKPPGKAPHMKGSSPMAESSEGDADADEIIATDEAVADAELANLGGAAPQPTAPIPAADVKAWADAVNEVSGALSGGQVPPVPVELPERADVWNQPLPAPAFGICMLIVEAIKQVDTEGKFASLLFDPVALGSTPEGVKDMTDKLKSMARDSALKEAVLKAPPPEAGRPMPPSPAPGGEPMPPGGDTQMPMV